MLATSPGGASDENTAPIRVRQLDALAALNQTQFEHELAAESRLTQVVPQASASPPVAQVQPTPTERDAMAKCFERADQCRLPIPYGDDLRHRNDLIYGDELERVAVMIRGRVETKNIGDAIQGAHERLKKGIADVKAAGQSVPLSLHQAA